MTRTQDTRLKGAVLYQLSYGTMCPSLRAVVRSSRYFRHIGGFLSLQMSNHTKPIASRPRPWISPSDFLLDRGIEPRRRSYPSIKVKHICPAASNDKQKTPLAAGPERLIAAPLPSYQEGRHFTSPVQLRRSMPLV